LRQPGLNRKRMAPPRSQRNIALQLHMVSVNVPDQRLSLELFDAGKPES